MEEPLPGCRHARARTDSVADPERRRPPHAATACHEPRATSHAYPRAVIREVWDELKSIGGPAIDAIIGPIVFVSANQLAGLTAAALAAGLVALSILVVRVVRGDPTRFAIGGLAGTGLAVGLALRSGRAEDYFLPGIISGAATSLAVLASVLVKRPLVAFTSWFARGWPLEWYWHPRVRPAYSTVAWLWVGFFGLRAWYQWTLASEGALVELALIRVATGWPGTVTLLVVSYLVGRRMLVRLGGPSVEEFASGAEPPWQGQQTGF